MHLIPCVFVCAFSFPSLCVLQYPQPAQQPHAYQQAAPQQQVVNRAFWWSSFFFCRLPNLLVYGHAEAHPARTNNCVPQNKTRRCWRHGRSFACTWLAILGVRHARSNIACSVVFVLRHPPTNVNAGQYQQSANPQPQHPQHAQHLPHTQHAQQGNAIASSRVRAAFTCSKCWLGTATSCVQSCGPWIL